MSCTTLGLTDEGVRLSKSADLEIILRYPASYDFTDYDGEFVIKVELDDVSAELTVTTTATAAGSVMVFADNLMTVRLKKADSQTLPNNAEDAAAPWVGWCEWVVTDTADLTSRLFQLPLIAERGAAE